MSAKSLFGAVIVAIVVVILATSLYIVKDYQKALVLRFGEVHIQDVKPGLHFKVPVMDQVKIFDGRLLTLDEDAESFFTIQNEPLEVDSYAKWRIKDADTYYTTTGGDENVAKSRLQTRINNGLRNEFGSRTVPEVVSGERDELMKSLVVNINNDLDQELGIEVVDIRVKKIELPPSVREDVYRRMASGREKEARDYRSKGKEQAEIIRADADRQRTVIEAEANRDAEIIRGEGDAKAAAIYAEAYNRDPEFYSFVRSLNAYKNTFSGKSDIMLVDPDSEFFRYLKDSTIQ